MHIRRIGTVLAAVTLPMLALLPTSVLGLSAASAAPKTSAPIHTETVRSVHGADSLTCKNVTMTQKASPFYFPPPTLRLGDYTGGGNQVTYTDHTGTNETWNFCFDSTTRYWVFQGSSFNWVTWTYDELFAASATVDSTDQFRLLCDSTNPGWFFMWGVAPGNRYVSIDPDGGDNDPAYSDASFAAADEFYNGWQCT